VTDAVMKISGATIKLSASRRAWIAWTASAIASSQSASPAFQPLNAQ
jgi:hypothetical protein